MYSQFLRRERVGRAEFLTTDEKRAAVGYGPMPDQSGSGSPPPPAAGEGGVGVYDQESPSSPRSRQHPHPDLPPLPAGEGVGPAAPTPEQAIILARALKALDDDDIDRAEALLEGLLAKGYPEFNPAQERVPAGDPSGRGGQWSGSGSLGGGRWGRLRGGSGLEAKPVGFIDDLIRGIRGAQRALKPKDPGRSPSTSQAPRPDTRPTSGLRQPGDRPRITEEDFLAREEGGAHNGHTGRDHIDRTEEELQQDVSSGSKRQSSRWSDRKTANKMVATAIRHNQKKIDRWLENGKDQIPIYYKGDRPIGIGYDRGKPGRQIRTNVIVVIQKDGHGGYAIFTAYPD